MKEKYYERLKTLSKDPNSSMLFWGYEASAIIKEIEKLKWHIIMIKEAIDNWNIKYQEGYVDFEIPKEIIDIVWSDKE